MFTFVLQPTYHRTGFFNVGVLDQHCIGADGESMEIFLALSYEAVLGTINRRANANGTPRIMGGTKVRDWFQEHVPTGSRIKAHVYSPTSIRLTFAGVDNTV